MFKLLAVPMRALEGLLPTPHRKWVLENAKRAPRGALCDAYSRIEKTAATSPAPSFKGLQHSSRRHAARATTATSRLTTAIFLAFMVLSECPKSQLLRTPQ